MALLESVILRDTRANQPAASTVATGSLYCVTDESNIVERSNGTTWDGYSPTGSGSGDVVGPASSVAGNLPSFADTSGTLLADSGESPTTILADALTAAKAATPYTLGVTIDGAGTAITTGIKGYVQAPYAGTLTKVVMFADQSGSAVVDVWKDTYANFPPVNADSITASAPPTISAAVKSEDATLTGWTTAVSAGDVFAFNVDSAATITRLTVQLTVVRA